MNNMSVIRKMVSMNAEDVEFMEMNSISLSKLVRNNIKKLKETHSPEQVPTPKEEVYVL